MDLVRAACNLGVILRLHANTIKMRRLLRLGRIVRFNKLKFGVFLVEVNKVVDCFNPVWILQQASKVLFQTGLQQRIS